MSCWGQPFITRGLDHTTMASDRIRLPDDLKYINLIWPAPSRQQLTLTLSRSALGDLSIDLDRLMRDRAMVVPVPGSMMVPRIENEREFGGVSVQIDPVVTSTPVGGIQIVGNASVEVNRSLDTPPSGMINNNRAMSSTPDIRPLDGLAPPQPLRPQRRVLFSGELSGHGLVDRSMTPHPTRFRDNAVHDPRSLDVPNMRE